MPMIPRSPATNYFKIVKEVIEGNIQAIASTKGISVEDAYPEVRNFIESNSKEWRSDATPAIAYEEPLCRIAYLFSTVAANANLIDHVFESDPELETFFDSTHSKNGEIRVCSFGGGPGTELLGLVKWIERRKLDENLVLDFLLLDKVSEWADSWYGIQDQIKERFKVRYSNKRGKWPVVTSGNFLPIDITDTSSFGNLGTVFGQDLYIMSYLISDVFNDESLEDLSVFASKMADHAPLGSKFLFIDRNEQCWIEAVNELASEAGLQLSSVNETDSHISNDEQTTDLGKLIKDVGWTPRTTWNAFWVVGTKY